jgi:hypothetical protein
MEKSSANKFTVHDILLNDWWVVTECCMWIWKFKYHINVISDTFPFIIAQTQDCSNSSQWLKYIVNSKSDLKTWADRTIDRPKGRKAHKESQWEEWMNGRMNTWVGRWNKDKQQLDRQTDWLTERQMNKHRNGLEWHHNLWKVTKIHLQELICCTLAARHKSLQACILHWTWLW